MLKDVEAANDEVIDPGDPGVLHKLLRWSPGGNQELHVVRLQPETIQVQSDAEKDNE